VRNGFTISRPTAPICRSGSAGVVLGRVPRFGGAPIRSIASVLVAAVYWPEERDTPRVLTIFRRYAPLVVIATFVAGWTLLLPFALHLGPEFVAMVLAVIIGVIGTYPSRRK
jgi:hypothetical protein